MPAGSVLQIGTDSCGQSRSACIRGSTGLQDDLQRRAGWRSFSAPAIANSSRSHFQGTDIWSTGRSRNRRRARAGSAAISTRCRRRSIRWPPGTRPRETPRTLLARTVGVPAIPNAGGYAFASPNSGAEAAFAARQRDAHRVAPAGRSAAPRVRQRDRAGRVRHARSRRARSRTYAPTRDLSEQRLRAGAAGRRRRDGQAASARRCSGCRPAASTRTPARTRTRPTARTPT